MTPSSPTQAGLERIKRAADAARVNCDVLHIEHEQPQAKSKEVTMARSYLPSLFGRDDDPFGSLFREVQKTFEDFSRRPALAGFGSDVLTPKIDIAETKDEVNVTAELPGVDEKDVDVTLGDGMLIIRGEKKSERDETDKDKNWYVVERSYGSFSRSSAAVRA